MKTPQRIDLDLKQVDALLKRAKALLPAEDYEIIKAMVETIHLLSQSVDQKAASIRRLLRMLLAPPPRNLKRRLVKSRSHPGKHQRAMAVDRPRTTPMPKRSRSTIGYMLKHWEALTLFLKVSGAPLDNNLCEQALKKAILHRKNALFYKTEHGAKVGDLFMSLIHTCNLAGVNPFDYLTVLQEHAAELSEHPGRWMPWNYTSASARTESS